VVRASSCSLLSYQDDASVWCLLLQDGPPERSLRHATSTGNGLFEMLSGITNRGQYEHLSLIWRVLCCSFIPVPQEVRATFNGVSAAWGKPGAFTVVLSDRYGSLFHRQCWCVVLIWNAVWTCGLAPFKVGAV
jgi:hypothetical protein